MINCITLLSDFGLRDASSATVRGILMQHTNVPIVDISHEVTPFLATQAAYLLGSAYRNFPARSVHVVLFDVFPTAGASLVLSEYEGHYFLASDNGVVARALHTTPPSWLCLAPSDDITFNDWLTATANTIKKLQHGPPASLSLPSYSITGHPPRPGTTINELECEVIHVDQYENVVLNITQQQFETVRNGRNFRIQFVMVEEIEELSSSYSDVREGYKLCRFNSNDHLEICINRGRAASLFGLRLGSNHNNIKILFE